LILVAGLLAVAAAAYDYNTGSTGIDHSGGVLLVLGSSLLMILGALVLLISGSGPVAGIFLFLVLLDILGTGFAAYMLESGLILGAMVLAAVGWLLRISNTQGAAL
jgi:mannose/fructose/N-acetylgalactosamine-specific phosphotransferase system component IID